MTIVKIPDDRLRSLVEDIQWSERNFWKDMGFIRSDTGFDDARIAHQREISDIIANYEVLNGSRAPGNTIGDLLIDLDIELLEFKESTDYATFTDNVIKLIEEFKGDRRQT